MYDALDKIRVQFLQLFDRDSCNDVCARFCHDWTRKALTTEEIYDACYVDINSNLAVLQSLKNNHKVSYDGKRFSYKSKHDLKGKDNLLSLIRKHPEGLPVVDVKDSYTNVLEDLQGSAADVAMSVMLEIDRNPQLKELGRKLLLQDYVATRWYHALELCGSFFSK